jgi:2-keto-4-pentenoate hydratase/2-oxohepta-3-ene-1,7-dioic acid hydratase in catechol pathway
VNVSLVDGRTVAVGTIYGIGRNYAAHAAELSNPAPAEPVVFLKARTSVRGLTATAPIAFEAETFHHEVELVLLIGREVPLGSRPGWGAVEAVTLGLDLTRRAVQDQLKAKGLPWTTSKSFAGSAVLAPFLPVGLVGDPTTIRFELEVAGELRQRGTPRSMLFDVPTVLAFLASLAPLAPGDLVFTGTPEGVGPIRKGDPFRMRLDTSEAEWAFDGIL